MKEIDYDFEHCDITCDNCNKSQNIDDIDYTEINKELKMFGWVIKYIDGEWLDFCCQKCYIDYIKKI